MKQAEKIAVAANPYAVHWQHVPTVIVGAGPVGQRMAAELRQHDPDREIVLFGEEPWAPYDRVQLSSWLAGAAAAPAVAGAGGDEHLHQYLGTRITSIDRDNRLLTDRHGASCPYDRLVLATGSRAFIPPIPDPAPIAHQVLFEQHVVDVMSRIALVARRGWKPRVRCAGSIRA